MVALTVVAPSAPWAENIGAGAGRGGVSKARRKHRPFRGRISRGAKKHRRSTSPPSVIAAGQLRRSRVVGSAINPQGAPHARGGDSLRA